MSNLRLENPQLLTPPPVSFNMTDDQLAKVFPNWAYWSSYWSSWGKFIHIFEMQLCWQQSNDVNYRF